MTLCWPRHHTLLVRGARVPSTQPLTHRTAPHLCQVGLGKFEGGDLAQAFMRMGDTAELLSKSAREQSAALSTSFEAPLKVQIRIACC